MAAALALAAAAFAQDLPKPSALTQKELDAKQISYNDWLFFHGIRSGNLDWVNAALKAGARPGSRAMSTTSLVERTVVTMRFTSYSNRSAYAYGS